jgi:hypothetical protein
MNDRTAPDEGVKLHRHGRSGQLKAGVVETGGKVASWANDNRRQRRVRLEEYEVA